MEAMLFEGEIRIVVTVLNVIFETTQNAPYYYARSESG